MYGLGSPLLEFRGICKSYKKKEVLRGISFNVRSGEIFGLVGPSGGGKTTFLKIIMGMLPPDRGEIFFEQKDVLKKIKYLRKNTGFATQENTLFDELSIRENSMFFGKIYGMKRGEIKENFMQLVSLLRLRGFEGTQVKQLSGGMSKRANLLVSLIHRPKLLMLDEPTTGLDPLLRKTLWNYIHEINRTGTTILVTSHLLDEIENNCDRIAVLNGGGIAEIGTPEQYKKAYGEKSFEEIFREIIG